MHLHKIPYITLWVNKFDECCDFYKNTLKLKVKFEMENFIQFATEGTELYIHKIMQSGEVKLRDHTVEVHFSVADVDKTHDSLKEKGVIFETEPKNMPWGTRVCAFKDPEGFVVELVGPLKEGEPVLKYGEY